MRKNCHSNEYGVELDRNGYAPSILAKYPSTRCHICYRNMGSIQRHEVFHGSNREKSKRFGLWINVCHSCHYQIHNGDGLMDSILKQDAQKEAMRYYGWTTEKWREIFGKNYL